MHRLVVGVCMDPFKSRRTWRGGSIVIVLTFLLPGASAGLVDDVASVDATAGARLGEVSALLDASPPIASRPLPSVPTLALIAAASALSADVGFPQPVALRVAAGGLPPEVAGRLAHVLDDVRSCHLLTRDRVSALGGAEAPWGDILRTGGGLNPNEFGDIVTCAQLLWTSVRALEDSLGGRDVCLPVGVAPIDIWPILYFDGTCTDSTYLHDYLIVVDVGGHDTYANNAGSNALDLNYAPRSSLVEGRRGLGEARGCQTLGSSLAAGDCELTAAVLLDVRGNDAYGRLEAADADAACTGERIVRRALTGGAGVMGVGILRDAGKGEDEKDAYNGKTDSLGAGLAFGVGLLSDAAGDDDYVAVRRAQGYGGSGGVGVLHDQAGDDRYDFVSAAVRDDEQGGVCDDRARFLQGTASVTMTALGVLVDEAGADVYHGAFVSGWSPNGRGVAGSAGFGADSAVGIFADRGGSDAYLMDGEAAATGSAQRVQIAAAGGASPFCDDFAPSAPCVTSTGSHGGRGVFLDRA